MVARCHAPSGQLAEQIPLTTNNTSTTLCSQSGISELISVPPVKPPPSVHIRRTVFNHRVAFGGHPYGRRLAVDVDIFRPLRMLLRYGYRHRTQYRAAGRLLVLTYSRTG